MQDFISGIQQIGIGVNNARESLRQYAKSFGMDTLVFDDTSEASLMTKYTGGNTYRRRALLSLNMQGGGGFEIWQFKNREPQKPSTLPEYGDIGIFGAKIKCDDVRQAQQVLELDGALQVYPLQLDGKNELHFWVQGSCSNYFDIVPGNHWFKKNGKKPVGGVTGAVIGVSDMSRSLKFYQSILNIDKPVYDITGLSAGPDGVQRNYRKVLLQKHPNGKGAFGKLLGSIELELVQCLDRVPAKIYENRYWGDCGFIHLCFDVYDMCGLKKYAEANGYTFTVDSMNSFGMEKASGRFCYIEDPDGTLIELVETHRVPILKRFGLYLNLKSRNLEKPLPKWMINLLSLSKVK
jgi:catechol 2,3-dioxygenase-like lactoylglutathione lyase family enzyme